MLGSETRMPVNLSGSFFSKGIADLDGAVIMDADNVSGQASSTLARSWAMKMMALDSRMSLPMRWWRTFIPRLNLPEQILRKAIPVPVRRVHVRLDFEYEAGELLFMGDTVRVVVSLGIGAGAISTKASSISLTPKLLTAAAKKTGVWLPLRYSSRINGFDAPSSKATSSRSSSAWLPSNSSRTGSSDR